MKNESELNLSNQSFTKNQKKEIEALVGRLNLDRGDIERGDFIATLRADAERIQSARQFKADKDVAQGGTRRNVRNDFADNSITQFHMQAIEEVTNTIKNSTRHELKNNMQRIDQLAGFLETSDVHDKKFLQQKYSHALKLVEVEHAKKSKLSKIVGNNLLDLTTQYLDIKSIAHGLFDNNPAMMAAFSVTSKAIKKVRENKELKDKTLRADAEATVVNTRAEQIKGKRDRKESQREADLIRYRNENGTEDDGEVLGAFGGGDAPTKITKQAAAAETSQQFGGGGNNIRAVGNNGFNQVEGGGEQSLELAGMVQKDVQLIREFLVKDKKSDRSEELQRKSKSKEKALFLKKKDKAGKDDDEDESGIFGMLGDFFGGGKGGKGRKGRKGRKGKGGFLRKMFKGGGGLLKRGAGLAKAGMGLAVGGTMLGSLLGGGADVIPDKKLPDIASTVVKDGAGKGAAKGASKGLLKTGSKGLGKGIGKSILKKIPGVGLLMGLAFAGERLMSGDLGGAGLEALSGLASTIPGLGTLASVGIDGALMAKDAGVFDEDEKAAAAEKAANDAELTKKDKYVFVPPEKIEWDENPSGLILDGEDENGIKVAKSESDELTETADKKEAEVDKTQLEVLEEMLEVMQEGTGNDIIRITNDRYGHEKLDNVVEAMEEVAAANKPLIDNIPESQRVRDVLTAGEIAIQQFSALFGGNPIPVDKPTKIDSNVGAQGKPVGKYSNIPDSMLSKNQKKIKYGGDGKKPTGLYAKAINDPNYELGALTRISETGKLDGAGTISTGVGDFGGKSYGSNQLSSKTGTLQKYLGQSQFGSEFDGLQPGSKEFDAKWKQVAARDKGFGKDQNAFIDKTHFSPFKDKAEKAGLNVSNRSSGVQEILHSTANQFGANTSIFKKFAKSQGGADAVNQMSDSDLIQQFSQYKSDNVGKYFRSSSGNVQSGVKKRFERERVAALGLDKIQAGMPSMGMDSAGINTASNAENKVQIAALESKTDSLNKAKNDKQAAPVVVASGGGGDNRSSLARVEKKGSGMIASSGLISRNLDSTISRLSDRFISDSLS